MAVDTTAVSTRQGRMTRERMAGTMPVHAPIFPEPPFYYRNLELLAFTYETDPEGALDVLPDCLELELPATATLAILDAPICTLGAYQEAFQSISAYLDGEPVQYVVNNLLTSDAAVAVGREIWGVPKKMGYVTLEKNEQAIIGTVERPRGTRLATGYLRPERIMSREEAAPFPVPLLTLRVIPHPEGDPPQIELIEHFSPETNNARVTDEWYENQFTGTGNVTFDAQSSLDPWHLLPVRRMLRAMHSSGPWSFELPYGRILRTL
jgi:acetoacetate decarboxylase